jgi:hypothetical protein
VWRSTVRAVARNGIKLWQGGDVVDCVVDGTGADTSLSGGPGRYRYLRTSVSGHNRLNPGASSYVGVWAYGVPRAVDLEVTDCTFRNNSLGARPRALVCMQLNSTLAAPRAPPARRAQGEGCTCRA